MMDRAQFVADLARYLQGHDGTCAVVGDADRLAREPEGDIDIVVDQHTFAAIGPHLLAFAHEHGMQVVQELRHEPTAWYFVLAAEGPGGSFELLAVDICSDYVRFGRRYLGARALLAGVERRCIGEIQVPVIADPVNFRYMLVKKIEKGDLSPMSGALIARCYSADPEAGQSFLRRHWRGEQQRMLLLASATDAWDDVVRNIAQLRRGLRRSVRRSGADLVLEAARVTRRVLRPTGWWVAFLGVDGAGKSTVLERVAEDLAPAFRRVSRFHSRPRTVDVRFGDDPGPTTEPHAQAPRSVVGSWAKLALWYADYWAGYVAAIRPQLIRSTFVLFDRYFADMLIDPVRYRYGGSLALLAAAVAATPSPHSIVLLDVDPASARKAEVAEAELTRMRAAYKAYTRSTRGGRVVDASQPLACVVHDVEAFLLAALAQRTRKRLMP